jgi:hypothetical protein
MSLPSNLPMVAVAKLPGLYVEAKKALAECARVDECKSWADKAAALASYAKQARDEELFKTATRIRARAIDRAGELLDQYDGRGNKSKSAPPRTFKKNAARDAGMSKRQQRQAVNVHNVPREQFDALVDSSNPPTPAQLAEIGTKRQPILDLGGKSPSDFKAATALMGALGRFVAETSRVDLQAALRGADAEEIKDIKLRISAIRQWLAAIEENIR